VHGQGLYTWYSGEYYDGLWVKGLKEGYGVCQGLAADQYIGEWNDNQPNGFGKHTWGNGDVYEGVWKACMRHG